MLAAYRVANIFNRVSDFPSGLPKAFLHITTGVICAALGFEFLVVQSSADTLLGSAFGLIPFSFHLIPVW